MKLDMHVNRALLPFKAVYFLFLAGMACVMPFLPIYMHQLGLTIAETGLIRSLEPAVSFVASPIWGSLADKHSKHKIILIVSIFASSVLTFAIIFIPSTEMQTRNTTLPIQSEVLESSGTAGEDLQGDLSWNFSCSVSDERTQSSSCEGLVLKNWTGLDDCSEFCDAALLPSSDRLASDVHLSCAFCLPIGIGNVNHRSEKSSATTQTVNVSSQKEFNADQVLRVYCLQVNSSQDSQRTNKCTSEATVNETDLACAPFMQNFPQNSSVCEQWHQCSCANLTTVTTPAPRARNSYVLVLMFVLILLSKVFICNVFPVLDSTLMVTLGKRPQDYGKQRMWGAVSWGAFAIIGGAAIDAVSRGSAQVNFKPAFYLFISLEAFTFVSAFFIVIPPHKANKKILKNLCGVLMQANVVTFLLVVTVTGMSFGITSTYFFLFLEELHSPHFLMGMTLTINCISEVPFLFFAGRIIKRISYVGVAYLTLLLYALRFLGYSLISNPWGILPFELLHGFTYGAFWAACTSFASANAPSGMTTTLQAVISGFHVGVGKGVGTALGGVVYQEWGSRTLFRVCLFTCLGTAVLYFILRRLLVEGVEGPLALYRKFSLVRGEISSTDGSRKDSCLSELDTDTCKAMENQRMQLTMTCLDQSNPDSPPVTKTFITHRPVIHNIQLPNTPDSPGDDTDDSPGSSSLSKLLCMEDRLPAVGQETLEMRNEGRPPIDGQENTTRRSEGGNKRGEQTMV